MLGDSRSFDELRGKNLGDCGTGEADGDDSSCGRCLPTGVCSFAAAASLAFCWLRSDKYDPAETGPDGRSGDGGGNGIDCLLNFD